MALLHSDGFALWTGAISGGRGQVVKGYRATGSGGTLVSGRNANSTAAQAPSDVIKDLAYGGQETIIGAAFKNRAAAPSNTSALAMGTTSAPGGSPTNIVDLFVNNTGSGTYTLSLYRGSSVGSLSLSTVPVPGTYSYDQWYYLELKVDWINGTIELRIDGTVKALFTGTTLGAAAYLVAWVSRNVGATLGGMQIADYVVLDSIGGNFNGYLGDVIIETLRPTADGATSDWTPDTGSAHHSRLSEALHDSDTSYVGTATVGAVDTYALTDLVSGSGAVLHVRPVIVARKESAAARSVALAVRSLATDSYGSGFDLPTALTYEGHDRSLALNPITAAAWTRAEVNALEAGTKLIS